MSDLPHITRKHKICVICEGFEDYEYFKRLTELNIWSSEYDFRPINAKSASNIPARYQNELNNDNYEVILIFCDTDKSPHREYENIKKKINNIHADGTAFDKIVIFANPCTMQIILSHFGDVELKNQGKKTNAETIKKFTGISDYDAHDEQVKELCGKIYQRTYRDMKERVAKINFPYETPCSTNFIVYLDRFENDNADWIDEISREL